MGTFFVGAITAIAVGIGIALTMGALAAVVGAVIGIVATASVGVGTIVAAGAAGLYVSAWFSKEVLPKDLYLPIYAYSAEEIFKGNILLFDVNFFNPKEENIELSEENRGIFAKCKDGTILRLKDYKKAEIDEKIDNRKGLQYYFYYTNENGILTENITSKQDMASDLRNTISKWYNALRNICIVLMLSILVYMGIRILLSSVSSDKAKYLSMLKDWFVGLCLLFLMHYIMAFSVTLVEKLTDVVKTSVEKNGYTVILEADKHLKKAVDSDHLNMEETISEDGNYIVWPCNLMGYLRLSLQMEDESSLYIGYCICFVILCLFTVYFTVTYLKRTLHMAFLTIIAPMVALTYCIDKLNDGQAQGFNKWFKEYIFNLLIQPMHLLLYYILVTSAFELAGTNVIYSIVAIGFLIPAEKLLRSLFGFEKAQTAPAMGPAGAMMASSMLTSLLHKGTGGKGEGKNGKSDGDKSDSDKPPIRSKMDPVAELAGGEDSSADTGGERPDVDGEQDDDELSEEGQAWLDYAEDDDNLMPVSNPSEGSDELSEEGQAWLDYAEDDDNLMPESNAPKEVEEVKEEPETLETPREQPTESESQQEDSKDKEEQEKNPTIRQKMRDKIGSTKVGRRVLRNFDANRAAQRAAVRNIPRQLKRNIQNAHPIRTVGKIAAGAAVGTAAGAVGLAIAASTGDLSNVAKMGGGAAVAGYALGSGAAKNIKSPMQNEVVQSVHKDAYTKGEYKEDAMNDYVEDHRKDPKLKGYLEASFGKDIAKEMLQKGGECEKYFREGITDKDDIKAMHKMKDEGLVKDEKEAIAITQLGKQIGSDTTAMGKEKRDDWEERLAEMSAEQKNIKDKKKFAKYTLSQIDKWNEYKK